jgi:hypothetical protein
MRFVHLALVVVLIGTFTGARASAQETSSPSLRPDATAIQPATPAPPTELVAAPRPQRPALVPLYISFGVLQGLDVHSTVRALENGAVEANPLMKGFRGQRVRPGCSQGSGRCWCSLRERTDVEAKQGGGCSLHDRDELGHGVGRRSQSPRCAAVACPRCGAV